MKLERPGPCGYCDDTTGVVSWAACTYSDETHDEGSTPCIERRAWFDAGHAVATASATATLNQAQAMIVRLEMELEDARDRAPTSPRRAIQ